MIKVTSVLAILVMTTVLFPISREANCVTLKNKDNHQDQEARKWPADESLSEILEQSTIVQHQSTEYINIGDQEISNQILALSVIPAAKLKRDASNTSTAVDFDPKAREDGYFVSKPEDSAYSVFILLTFSSGNQSICSGSLLTVEWVLSSAHCLFSSYPQTVTNLTVTAGAVAPMAEPLPANAQQVEYDRFIFYPEYNPTLGEVMNFHVDVLLVKTKQKFVITKYVGTIQLSLKPWDYEGYQKCVVVGFGKVVRRSEHADDMKRKTHNLSVKKPCVCSWVFGPMKSSFICAKPEEDYGFCSGDSGSGLVCGGEIRGIVTFFGSLNPYNFCQMQFGGQCGSRESLHGVLDSCPFLSWINKHVKILSAETVKKVDRKNYCFPRMSEDVNLQELSSATLSRSWSALNLIFSLILLGWYKIWL